MSRMLQALQTIQERRAAKTAATSAADDCLATMEHLLGTIDLELSTPWETAWADPLILPAEPAAAERVTPRVDDLPAAAARPAKTPPVAPQYHELAADLADTWDLPVAVTLAGATAGRAHEVVGLSLASALAQILNIRVLVVDGDFRDPAVAAKQDAAGTPRLHDLLTGGSSCRGLAVPTIYPGVDVLSLAWDESCDGRLGAQVDFSRLVTACKAAYDVVLVMAPPLGQPETPALAAAGDGTYLVVRLGHTTARALRKTAQSFLARGAAVLGTIALADD